MHDDAPAAIGPWTRRSRRVAYENPWVTVWHDEVTRPDGEPGVYGVVHFANLAAGVLALDEDDRVLLVGQHRYTDEFAVLYLATGLTAGEASPDGTEDLALRWLPFEEVLDMTLDGRITDAMTIIAVERVALLRRLGR